MRMFTREPVKMMTTFQLSSRQKPFIPSSYLLIKNDKTVLRSKIGRSIFLHTDIFDFPVKSNLIYIGELNNTPLFAMEQSGCESDNLEYIPFHNILDSLDPNELKAFFRSCHLLNWNMRSQFCGCCGKAVHMADNEFAKVCEDNPTHRTYPAYSPSMVVLLKYEDKILLGRSPHFQPGMYSTLAGFVEAGETCEDAVRREVMEEVGVTVKNIKPLTTAPWPFPNTLMMGFEAEAVSPELTIDKNELEDAQWFDLDNLPLLPPKATISYQLVAQEVAKRQLEDVVTLKYYG